MIGGGMVFTFLKARGLGVGSSLVEDDKIDLVNTATGRGDLLGHTRVPNLFFFLLYIILWD